MPAAIFHEWIYSDVVLCTYSTTLLLQKCSLLMMWSVSVIDMRLNNEFTEIIANEIDTSHVNRF